MIGFNGVNQYQAGSQEASNKDSLRSKASIEFATMFYEQLLKQSVSDDFAGIGDTPYANMAKDIFIKKMARELADKNPGLLESLQRRGDFGNKETRIAE